MFARNTSRTARPQLVRWAALGAILAGAGEKSGLGLGAAATAVAACVLTGCSGPTDEAYVFPAPVQLSDVLAVPGLLDPGSECVFSIQDAQGRPVPNALLRFQWPEAGRVAFQTDRSGAITMRLSSELDGSDATLSAESKPDGQDLLAAPYDESTQRIVHARIAVRVRSQD